MTSQKEILWEALDKWLNNNTSKIDAEKYLRICEQLGQEPNPEKMPIDFGEFPFIVQQAIIVYNSLGDKIVPDVGYLGKDFTSLPLHIEVQQIDNKDFFLEILLYIDRKNIEKSAQEVKAAREKASKKMPNKPAPRRR